MRKHTATRRTMLAATGSVALFGAAGVASASSPDVETDGADNVTTDSATLHGTLLSLGVSDTVFVQFQYGEDLDVSEGTHYTTHEAMSATGSFSHGVTYLEPDTVYEFRARAESEDGSTVKFGRIETFKTDSEDNGGGDDGCDNDPWCDPNLE